MTPKTAFGFFKRKWSLIAVLTLQASNIAKEARRQKKYDIALQRRITTRKNHLQYNCRRNKMFQIALGCLTMETLSLIEITDSVTIKRFCNQRWFIVRAILKYALCFLQA